MSELILSDAATVNSGGRRKTRAGYLVTQARVAKAGNIQLYTGVEAGMPDKEIVRIYRPEEAVFDHQTAAAWAFKPITLHHPRSGSVTSQNWKDEAIGVAGGEVMRDGDFLSIPMCIMDAATIEAIESGAATEVSCGYRVALDATPGTTPQGEPYDAKVSKIVPDHIAVVPKGRAGSECRIGDSAGSTPSPTDPQPRKDRPMADGNTERAVILVDGFTVETTPQGREAIQRLQTQLNDARAATDAVKAANQVTLDSLNGQLAAARQALTDETAKKEGDLAGLKLQHQTALDAANAKIAELEQRTSPAALEAMAASRAATIAVARRVLGDAFTGAGMSDADIRKQTVLKAVGATLTDAEAKPQLFFDHVFEAVAATPPLQSQAQPPRPDPMRVALATNPGPVALDAAKQEPTPFDKYHARLTSAYRNAPANGVI